jgi:hypothetical protein
MSQDKPDQTGAQCARVTASNALIAGQKLFALAPASGHGVLEACTSWENRPLCPGQGAHSGMKVHLSTPTRLEIRHRPVFWAVVFGCILFVLAGWGLAGLLEGEWMAALIAVGIGAVMGWLVFRQILLSFSLVLDRDADRITYHDTKGVRIDTPLARLTSVACDAKLDTDNGEAQRALVLHLEDADEPAQIRLSAFKLRTEDVLDCEHAVNQWLGQDADAVADKQGLEITVPVLPVAWVALAFCAFAILNAPVALFSGEVVRAALLIAIGGGAGYVWLEKVLVRLDLTFDPADGVIRMRRSNMLGTTTWLLPLRHVDGAELIEQVRLGSLRTSKDRSANVDLLFRNTRPNMTISLSPLGIPEAEAKRIASQINAWLQDLGGPKA